MKLGILTAPFAETSLADVASWSASAGFEALEIACWPSASGEKRRYAGTSHIAVEEISKAEAIDIADLVAARGLSISGLGYYPNPLHPDAAHRETVVAHLKKVIRAAGLMNVKVVNTFVGGNRTLTVDQNWENAVPVFTDVVKLAQDNGVTLAFENCPMIFSPDEWPGGHNIAYAPKIWRRIFETLGDAVGMNYDPSHLVWQMIDNGRFIREFGGTVCSCSRQGSDDRPRRALRERHYVLRYGLAGAAHAGIGRHQLGRNLRGPLPGGL